MPASSQGSTVTFDGDTIGQLVGWSGNPGRAVVQDVSSAESYYDGAGTQMRLWRQVECMSVEPGRATYTLLGVPPHTKNDIGKKATLSISYSGGDLTAEAFLEEFEITGSVGELLKGSATFILTGDV
jgi:hypothetical protein